MTTNAYTRGVKQLGWPPYPGKLWQRNYYERVIRNERELDAIRAYVVSNPARWADDPENTGRR
jgi:REP element-mobilizing transposase RayT